MKTLALIPLVLGLAAGGAGAAQENPRELVYVSGSGKAARLYVIREDGTGKRRLTKSTSSESLPVYSPDGRRIAFVSLRTGNFKIFVMNADGSNERPLTQTANWVADASPSWSPDGRWIAFASSRLEDGNPEIFRMRPDGSNVTRLTFTHTAGEISPDDGFPEWSPDGRSIVFTSTRDRGQHDLYVMRSDGKNVRRIAGTPDDDWQPRFSRDGTSIVFSVVGRTAYVVNIAGTGLRHVTRGTDPIWRP